MNWSRLARMSLLALALSAAGCGGGGGIGGTGSPAGAMHVSLGDAPACGYDAVNVTIEKVRVHQSASASDTDAGWSEIVLSPARRVDLLTLTNGVLEDLGQTSLPAGKYTQLRLVLASNDATTPLANSVVPTGGSETALDTPSAQQSGLKLNADIDVPADKVVDLVIDFNACKSVVRRGNSDKYNLKPVLSVTQVLSDAGMRVVGYVDPSIASTGTGVSVQSGGTVVKATVPDLTGKFVLYPVPVGTYDLVVTSTGHVTAVMTGVPVITTAYTYVNSAPVPIAPAMSASAPRSVTGTVTPASATLRALQSFAAGPTIEAQWAPVDATTGAFAAGKYTIEASYAGASKSQAIDASAPVPSLNFTFP